MYNMSKILALMVVVGLVAVAQAGKKEYSDAVGYGSTSHTTGEWQHLGMKWDKESSPLAEDLSDDGVSWSNDGGANWGNEPVRVGDTVIFRFNVTRAGYGRHTYDQLKAWVDWNGDKVWDNDPADGEVLIATQWFKDTVEDGDTLMPDDEYFDYVNQHNALPNPDAVLTKSFFTTIEIPEDAPGGCTWLRARVHCNHTTFDNITPYTNLTQGEVEDYKFCVTVPTPSALVLATIGMAIVRHLRGRNWA